MKQLPVHPPLKARSHVLPNIDLFIPPYEHLTFGNFIMITDLNLVWNKPAPMPLPPGTQVSLSFAYVAQNTYTLYVDGKTIDSFDNVQGGVATVTYTLTSETTTFVLQGVDASDGTTAQASLTLPVLAQGGRVLLQTVNVEDSSVQPIAFAFQPGFSSYELVFDNVETTNSGVPIAEFTTGTSDDSLLYAVSGWGSDTSGYDFYNIGQLSAIPLWPTGRDAPQGGVGVSGVVRILPTGLSNAYCGLQARLFSPSANNSQPCIGYCDASCPAGAGTVTGIQVEGGYNLANGDERRDDPPRLSAGILRFYGLV